MDNSNLAAEDITRGQSIRVIGIYDLIQKEGGGGVSTIIMKEDEGLMGKLAIPCHFENSAVTTNINKSRRENFEIFSHEHSRIKQGKKKKRKKAGEVDLSSNERI